jgi:negative regulator of flagellin synthesis FlgM
MNVQNDLQGLRQVVGGASVSGVSKVAESQAPTSNAVASDETHLSVAGNLIGQAIALPDVNAEKIAAVQAALADGSYQVSSANVADKLMNHMGLSQQ